jgi:IS4 transposase
MLFGGVFERFLKDSPLSVMSRATIEHALSASALDALFDRTAERGYTRELLFSTTVDLMALVVGGRALHVQAAYRHLRDRVPVTLKCVYDKLRNIETGVSAGLVSHVSGRCEALITELGGGCPSLLPGYRVRILDGNHLAATQRRLGVTRGHTAGPRPGQSLVVLDPALMLVTDIVPCEDAHTQERALIDQIVPLVRARDVWVADRNFCTAEFLCEVASRRAYVVTRRHGNLSVEAETGYGAEVETDRGWVSERRVWVCWGGGRLVRMRQVRVRLRTPTEDGDSEVEILTNLPASVSARKVAEVYLKRWTIEGAFHELTVALNCEVNTLGYPKAALFGFCVAVAAYNVLAVLKAALRAVHGERKVQEDVSGYYMALEWAMVYAGMMIALPASEWEPFGPMPSQELAGHLREWASKVDLERIKKAPPRKPTRTRTRRIKDKSPHVSTARLLDEAKRTRQAKASRNP